MCETSSLQRSFKVLYVRACEEGASTDRERGGGVNDGGGAREFVDTTVTVKQIHGRGEGGEPVKSNMTKSSHSSYGSNLVWK